MNVRKKAKDQNENNTMINPSAGAVGTKRTICLNLPLWRSSSGPGQLRPGKFSMIMNESFLLPVHNTQ
jgi:hypothetical protein